MSDPDESSQQEEPKSSQQQDPKPLPGVVAFLSMGLSAAICVGVGLLLGLWLDSALHTAPAFLLVGLALGLAVAALSVIKQIRTFL